MFSDLCFKHHYLLTFSISFIAFGFELHKAWEVHGIRLLLPSLCGEEHSTGNYPTNYLFYSLLEQLSSGLAILGKALGNFKGCEELLWEEGQDLQVEIGS